jgi:mannose-6-phosphate isomerase-like protein (cupin superfamily)
MKRAVKVTMLFAGLFAAAAQQTGTAVDIGNAEVQGVLRKTAASAVSDRQLRVVNIDGEYNVGVGVVHREKTKGSTVPSALEHSEITEIYHVISGSATFVTGGTLENRKAAAADGAVVKILNGPSSSGSAIVNGVSREIGPGDIVVIPPNTPHWFSAIQSDQIVYLVVRIDPHKVLPAGYDDRRVP